MANAYEPLINESGNNNNNTSGIEMKKMSMDGPTKDGSHIIKAKQNAVLYTDYIDPLSTVKACIELGYKKALRTTFRDIYNPFSVFLSAILSGSYLGFAITIVIVAIENGFHKTTAALLFPFGFLLLILSGNSLATGNFALLPMALVYDKRKKKSGRIDTVKVLVNWFIVYMGNFVGTMIVLFLFWGGKTHFDKRDPNAYASFTLAMCGVAESKIVSYKETGGASGWFAALFNGMLANWLVTLAVLLSLSTRSIAGKVLCVYLPISIFVALSFEHAIVNLFVGPAGLTFKCNYSFGDWIVWNQIPVTIGNIVGGASFTGFMFYGIYANQL